MNPEELYNKYRGFVLRLCYKYAITHEDAKDLLQIVFYKLLKHKNKFRGESNFSTWLYRVTINECLNYIRTKKREDKLFSLFKTKGKEETGDIFSIEWQVIWKEISTLLGQRKKMILFLHIFEGLSFQEIAEVLKKSRFTLYNDWKKIAAKLRIELEV